MNRGLAFLFSLGAVWLALDVVALIYGIAPLLLLREFLFGTWGTSYGIGQILFKATPLVFTGLSVRLALHAGLFNVGAEGQLTVASLAVAALGAHLPHSLFSAIALIACAAIAGGAFAVLPAYFSRKGGSGLALLATILMNRIADPLVALFLHAGLAEKGTTHTVPMTATFPRLDLVLSPFTGSAVSFAFPLALGVAAAGAFFLRRSRIAREWSFLRENAVAAKKVGIPVERRLAQAMIVSGAVAGLVGLGTVAGYKGYYEQGLGAGTGFAGIGVALLGGESALGLLAASLLFGTLAQGGLAVNALVPREVFQIFEAGIIVFVALLSGESWALLRAWAGRK